MPDSAVPSRRNVWVVLFDQLPLDSAGVTAAGSEANGRTEQIATAASSQFTSFDDLDQSSLYFEQYLIQDIRAAASITDTLGGSSVVQQFEDQLKQAGCVSEFRRLTCKGEPAALQVNSAEPFWRKHSAASQDSRTILASTGDPLSVTALDEVIASIAPDASLIWLDVELETSSLPQRIQWSGDLLAWLIKRLAEAETRTGSRPVLIVSAMRGVPIEIREPFSTMGDESVVHVPLWIDDGSRHACRLQRLAGSFDLLPTISHYLTGQSGEDPQSQAHATQTAVALADLHCQPTSLMRLLRSSELPTDRLLKLTADSWSGLRTQQYLLIHAKDNINPDDASSADDPDRFTPAITRGLFLKPDDLWNVQNSIVAYEAIADEMESVAAGQASASGMDSNGST